MKTNGSQRGRRKRESRSNARAAVLLEAKGAAVPKKWLWHYNALLSLRERLSESRRNQLRDASEALEPHSLDLADTASDQFDHDLILSELAAGQDALFEIDAAIARIRRGSYGICEATGEKIPLARLKAAPWARFAKRVEARLEKGGIIRAPRLGGLNSVQAERSAAGYGHS